MPPFSLLSRSRSCRIWPSTAYKFLPELSTLLCRTCARAAHSRRRCTCRRFASRSLSASSSHAPAASQSTPCMWLFCSHHCFFSTYSDGRRRMPSMTNVCDTPHTVVTHSLHPQSTPCMWIFCSYVCFFSTYSDTRRRMPSIANVCDTPHTVVAHSLHLGKASPNTRCISRP